MDRVPQEVVFSFADVVADTDTLSQPWQVYLRIVGNFLMTVAGRTLYTEQGFCLVEFAIQSQLWLRQVRASGEDFVYSSQESEEMGLVWIKRDNSKWKVGSIHQEYDEPRLFDLDQLEMALVRYFDALNHEVQQKFRVDITSLFDWAAKPRM